MTSLWRALAGNPVRFLRSSWPWRSVAHVVSTVAVASAVWGVALALLLFPPALLFVGVPIGALERRRLQVLMSAQIRDPHLAAPASVPAWVRRRLREAATWRELGYAVCLLSVILVLDLAALFAVLLCLLLLSSPLLIAVFGPSLVRIDVGAWSVDTVAEALLCAGLLGVPATVVTLYGVSVLAGAQTEFARWLLAPTGTELSREATALAQSRDRLVKAFEAERRRIERDLHDGAQQHLVLLTMKLGLARTQLTGDNERAGELVGQAHQQARLALAAIREQIRGIHPQVLTDFGLVEAVRELADRCPVPVEIDLSLPGRPPPEVESIAYFVVSEALTNVVRHAAATRIQVSGGCTAQGLTLAVVDDGHGGADPALGTGMRGLADRVAVLSGTLAVSSPAGGPTVVRIDLPCRCG